MVSSDLIIAIVWFTFMTERKKLWPAWHVNFNAFSLWDFESLSFDMHEPPNLLASSCPSLIVSFTFSLLVYSPMVYECCNDSSFPSDSITVKSGIIRIWRIFDGITNKWKENLWALTMYFVRSSHSKPKLCFASLANIMLRWPIAFRFMFLSLLTLFYFFFNLCFMMQSFFASEHGFLWSVIFCILILLALLFARLIRWFLRNAHAFLVLVLRGRLRSR